MLGRPAQIAGVSCARLCFSAAIKIDHRWRDDLLDRPRRKPPPEIIMDLAGIPCREVSDALRGAVEANQSKRFKK